MDCNFHPSDRSLVLCNPFRGVCNPWTLKLAKQAMGLSAVSAIEFDAVANGGYIDVMLEHYSTTYPPLVHVDLALYKRSKK
jgi:hypothetical protein